MEEVRSVIKPRSFLLRAAFVTTLLSILSGNSVAQDHRPLALRPSPHSSPAGQGLYGPSVGSITLDDIEQGQQEALRRMQELGNITGAPRAIVTPVMPPTIPEISFYYNHMTEQYFVGNFTFHADDHEMALATEGWRNTRRPAGVGWQEISESRYVDYLRSVKGLDAVLDQTIYNNCVLARSRGASESVLREVRASCRETARAPSRLESWRWGD